VTAEVLTPSGSEGLYASRCQTHRDVRRIPQ